MALAGWDDFFAALVGASAALAGLLFVGLSLNMGKIVGSRSLVDRALEALALLVGILVLSIIFLIPAQSFVALGVEVVAAGLGLWACCTTLSLRILALIEPAYRRGFVAEFVGIQGVAVAYLAAGFALVLHDAIGPYLGVPGMVVSFLLAILDSWVLLVEVNR